MVSGLLPKGEKEAIEVIETGVNKRMAVFPQKYGKTIEIEM